MDVTLDRLAKRVGDPWVPENPYFGEAERNMEFQWNSIVWKFILDGDFTATIDLACGHGRNSVYLAPLAKRLLMLDIQPGNIEVCRRRFVDKLHVECAVNNGYDLRPAEDGAFTFVYCFDAMVHFDSDIVRSYLRDARRVLQPGGRVFFHHSNLASDEPWDMAPASRNYMTRDLFAHYARKEGLVPVRQHVINWGHNPSLDCLSMFARPA